MSQLLLTPLFDFEPYREQRTDYLDLIRQFASHHAFRSAVVEELELDDDFYRRPLRPEDLEFLKFQRPISAQTVSRLPSLASNRLLLTINDLDIARLPRRADPAEQLRFEQFYEARNQDLGKRLRPFLESYAFSYLGHEGRDGETVPQLGDRLAQLVEDERDFWRGIFELLLRNGYLEEGLRFILIQRWCLAPTRRTALERARAAGYFAGVEQGDLPSLAGGVLGDAAIEHAAGMLGVARQAHSYWQFYLPTSLAKANLLAALAARPDRAYALLGAGYGGEAEWLAFGLALRQACPHLAGPLAEGEAQRALDDLAVRWRRTAHAVAERQGPYGLARAGQGLGAVVKLAERARWDLGEQLAWLSAIPQYCRWAQAIEQRIQAECPNIDRETFVEPREMCSTTHVHNDHRLVVIEQGDMVFWGNLGMALSLTVGDKVLIPDGRLHGSTVVSDECTYHQPIIPDDWIEALRAQGARPVALSA